MLSVIVNESTIEMSNSGIITGQIYFQIEDIYFPELYWDDFVVKTLEKADAGAIAEFNFMDKNREKWR
ncbi:MULTISPECIES: hypothetical protein [unclassified Paenibacillus]|uniref:hypothetical protein n=1 Tax=unclassified Paenibacillus TaxID=185978 RepID=UPI00056860E1|nr:MULTISPECIES: hypothetical protein [unclassified Paenibacillus]MCT2194291.1 hypothetical protein [Paenibacillus sp. p3-SID1389]